MERSKKLYRYFVIPYLVWMFLLVALPLLTMLLLSFMTTEGIDFNGAIFTFENFKKLAEPSVVIALCNSILYAGLSTGVCIVLGYLVAYVVYCSKFKNKFLILTIFILPMWSNLLLRSYALSGLLKSNNIISNMLSRIGINLSINLSGGSFAVVLGLVVAYLPFMILPIYTSLEKIDTSLQEAALDLGATEIKKFYKVILPLSLKGIIVGSILVFLPCASGFAVPSILSNWNILLIGNIIEDSIKYMDYNFGGLLAIIIIIFIFLSIYLVSKIDSKGETII